MARPKSLPGEETHRGGTVAIVVEKEKKDRAADRGGRVFS